MSLKTQIYSPRILLDLLTPTDEQLQFVARSKIIAKRIFLKKENRFPLIVGPCSIHNYSSAIAYAKKLKNLSDKVSGTLFLIMRAHVEKPRTTLGWKGLLYDPYLNGSNDISCGIRLSRKLFLDFAEIGIPIATEFLNPLVASYLQDLVSWGFIGARTSSCQNHRELASSLHMPIGFKNDTEGNLQLAINGAISSRVSHTFLGNDQAGRSSVIRSNGNPYTHIVLRGSDHATNYDSQNVQRAASLQSSCGLHSPILIDCTHGNSKKNLFMQKEVFLDVQDQLLEENPHILGLMLESFLIGGNQPFELGDTPSPDISITDPCLDWKTTENLILNLHSALSESKVAIPY